MSDLLNDRTADPAAELTQMLAESVTQARARESATFDSATGDLSSRIVLFGAGGLGRRTLSGLRNVEIEPCAFSDNNQKLWGTEIDGVPVFSPNEAADQFGSSATFVVSIWGADSPHRFADSVNQLTSLGCELVVPIAWLYWRHPQQLLPHYALDLPSGVLMQADAVRECFDLLDDERSRKEYVAQITWRTTGDPSCLFHPVESEQYLVTDIAQIFANEVVIDCGAYDGDTLRSWMAERGDSFATYFAMEPDPDSRARLESSVARLPSEIAKRVQVLPFAASGHTGTVTFSGTGLPSASVGAVDGITVDSIRLDDLEDKFVTNNPTFLKMDIEGAELDALEGATNTIRTYRPMLAIAAYHCQDHLWRVPLTAAKLSSEYRHYIRPHNEEGWDLIYYAVPPDRVV